MHSNIFCVVTGNAEDVELSSQFHMWEYPPWNHICILRQLSCGAGYNEEKREFGFR